MGTYFKQISFKVALSIAAGCCSCLMCASPFSYLTISHLTRAGIIDQEIVCWIPMRRLIRLIIIDNSRFVEIDPLLDYMITIIVSIIIIIIIVVVVQKLYW